MLVTGADGFVGRALVPFLESRGISVRAGVRRIRPSNLHKCETIEIGDLASRTDWSAAVEGVDAVTHLAARVHVMREQAADPLEEFRKINVRATCILARGAAAAGVRRFVFLSSVKVNGERTSGRPFRWDDPPAPEDPYAVSKLEAECALREIERDSGMEVVVIRPPLIYGRGVKGNLARMARLVKTGLPLPLGAVKNRRSLVGMGNLCSLIERCLTHPAAAGGTFLVSDGRDISTPDLIRALASVLSTRARLVAVPVPLLRTAFRLVGLGAEFSRLCGSLEVDIEPTCRRLEWRPPFAFEEGLRLLGP